MNLFKHIWTRLGDLAAFSGLYGAGCALAVFVFADKPVWWMGVLGAGLATWGVYLIDRIKLRDQDWDPADLAANVSRHAWLRARRLAVRLLALLMLATAMLVFGTRLWWLGLLPLGGLGAVVLYTAGPEHGKRPKDVLLLKNAMVATGMSVLAFGVVHAADGLGTNDWSGIIWLWLVVLGDAAVSDLDDRVTDLEFRTRTLATQGRSTVRAWLTGPFSFAIVTQFLAVGLLLASPVAAAGMAAAVPMTTAGVLLLAPERYRDWIDMRLPLLAGLAWLSAGS